MVDSQCMLTLPTVSNSLGISFIISQKSSAESIIFFRYTTVDSIIDFDSGNWIFALLYRSFSAASDP